MIITRTVLWTAVSSMFLTTPALAAAPEEHTGAQPCDAEALDGYYQWAAFHHKDARYLPADADADTGNEADGPDADSEGEEFAPDAEGCADITLAPYDMLIRPLTDDAKQQAVDLRRLVRMPVRKNGLI